ncbi:MAG: DUF1015 domain-containing protein [Lachnospiraceae bacterium]|nr:DUF1015 domain-containing protein [Lachnospiraceae bacterium]
MAVIKPFQCVRPSKEKVDLVAALPYDVYNREEAKEVVKQNPQSFLAIDRAETNFPDDMDMYAREVYEKASSKLQEWKANGTFVCDTTESYYLYELTMCGRTQTGIVACASIDDYVNEVIKKHENTRPEKEEDRICHVDICSAQTGPIFLAYRKKETITAIVKEVRKGNALYDFTSEDGIRHRVFQVNNPIYLEQIQNVFANMEHIYIADGHHRAASAVKVGLKRRQENPNYNGTEEFNYFLSVLFPDNELMIMDYNRVVKDLNGLSEVEFLEKVNTIFEMQELEKAQKPIQKGQFTMYLHKKWYVCTIKETDIPNDPVKSLDVSLLQDLLLEPVLGIDNPKINKRIDFVGGIRGLEELEKRCAEDCEVAFAMYPTSIGELFAVADANLLMPPKSTWFEPKLRSGIFIHEI